MGKLHISKAAMMIGKIVDTAWYPVTVKEVKQHPSKAGDSENTDVSFEILSGPFEGVQIFKTFNEKGAGFVVPFLKALGVEIPEDGGDFDLLGSKGRQLNILVKRGSYNGNPKNEIADYRPME